eukprot:TRINITY_DN198_c1_g1_i2.p1 TRINITY_DN198_c1_g1~~TRINITY_DN198_c1_g1_i2.p1  ORF type:complete len:363 (+),score=74.34 TRINITY_DN198_c1_g1_i2:1-1089(+)
MNEQKQRKKKKKQKQQNKKTTMHNLNKSIIDKIDENDNQKLKEILTWSPFIRNDKPLTKIIYLKIIFGLIFLFPLRILILILNFLLFWFLVYFFKFLNFLLKKDLQIYFQKLAYILGRITLFFFGFISIKRKIYSNSTIGAMTYSTAPIIVTNHISYLDIFILMVEELPSFVAKYSVKNLPIINCFCNFLQVVYKDKTSNTSVTNIIINQINQKILKRRIVIFPEGTTTNGQFLISFKSGAFVGGFPIQPILLKYRFNDFNLSWETIPLPYHLLRFISSWRNELEIIYLPVYIPSKEEITNPKLYAENIRKIMAKELKISMTNHTYQDKLEYHSQIRSGNYNWKPSLFKYNHFLSDRISSYK